MKVDCSRKRLSKYHAPVVEGRRRRWGVLPANSPLVLDARPDAFVLVDWTATRRGTPKRSLQLACVCVPTVWTWTPWESDETRNLRQYKQQQGRVCEAIEGASPKFILARRVSHIRVAARGSKFTDRSDATILTRSEGDTDSPC